MSLDKEESKNLYCLSMSENVEAELHVDGFTNLPNFNLLNVGRQEKRRFSVKIKDMIGKETKIYYKIKREKAGQQTIFYSKLK